jgi:hypothetical protein
MQVTDSNQKIQVHSIKLQSWANFPFCIFHWWDMKMRIFHKMTQLLWKRSDVFHWPVRFWIVKARHWGCEIGLICLTLSVTKWPEERVGALRGGKSSTSCRNIFNLTWNLFREVWTDNLTRNGLVAWIMEAACPLEERVGDGANVATSRAANGAANDIAIRGPVDSVKVVGRWHLRDWIRHTWRSKRKKFEKKRKLFS